MRPWATWSGTPRPRAGDVRAVQNQVAQPAVAGACRLPVAQQARRRPRSWPRARLTAVGDQDPRAGASLAGLHVLGEDQDLVLRRLDDRVQIAAEHERGRLKRLFVGHLDDVNARQLELLELEIARSGLYRAKPGTGAVHAASGATRPMSSDSTPSSPCFLRK